MCPPLVFYSVNSTDELLWFLGPLSVLTLRKAGLNSSLSLAFPRIVVLEASP